VHVHSKVWLFCFTEMPLKTRNISPLHQGLGLWNKTVKLFDCACTHASRNFYSFVQSAVANQFNSSSNSNFVLDVHWLFLAHVQKVDCQATSKPLQKAWFVNACVILIRQRIRKSRYYSFHFYWSINLIDFTDRCYNSIDFTNQCYNSIDFTDRCYNLIDFTDRCYNSIDFTDQW